jgi:hypothetical protein
MDLVFEMYLFFICAFLDHKKVEKVQKLSSLKLDVSNTFMCGNTGRTVNTVRRTHENVTNHGYFNECWWFLGWLCNI